MTIFWAWILQRKKLLNLPKEYRIMSYPQPERGETERADFDAAATMPPAADPQQPRPVIPIVLTAEKPADKVMENMTAALPDMDADMRELYVFAACFRL